MRPALLVAVLLLAACTHTGGGNQTASARLTGGSREQRALIRDILDGMGPSAIASVRVGAPPSNRFGAGSARWLWITARAAAPPFARDSRGSVVEPEWDASMLQAAYARRAGPAGVPGLRGCSLTLLLPGGRQMDDGSDTTGGLKRVLGGVSEGAVRAAYAAAGRQAHLDLRGIRLLHPDNTAVAAVYEAADPVQFGRRLYALAFLPRVLGHIDGYFVVVRDRCGRTVASFAAGGSESVSWVDPRWACPNPIQDSGPGLVQCPRRVSTPILC
jgi:hypothetical protein